MILIKRIREALTRSADTRELDNLREKNRQLHARNDELRNALRSLDAELAERGLVAIKGRITDRQCRSAELEGGGS